MRLALLLLACSLALVVAQSPIRLQSTSQTVLSLDSDLPIEIYGGDFTTLTASSASSMGIYSYGFYNARGYLSAQTLICNYGGLNFFDNVDLVTLDNSQGYNCDLTGDASKLTNMTVSGKFTWYYANLRNPGLSTFKDVTKINNVGVGIRNLRKVVVEGVFDWGGGDLVIDYNSGIIFNTSSSVLIHQPQTNTWYIGNTIANVPPADPYIEFRGPVTVQPQNWWDPRPVWYLTGVSATFGSTLSITNATFRFTQNGHGSLNLNPANVIAGVNSAVEIFFTGQYYSSALPGPFTANEYWSCQIYQGVCTLNLQGATPPSTVESTYYSTFRVLSPSNVPLVNFPRTRQSQSSVLAVNQSSIFQDHVMDYDCSLRFLQPGLFFNISKLTFNRGYFDGNGIINVNGPFNRPNVDWLYLTNQAKMNLYGVTTWDGWMQMETNTYLNVYSSLTVASTNTGLYWQVSVPGNLPPVSPQFNIYGQFTLRPPNWWNSNPSLNINGFAITVGPSGSIVVANSTLRFVFNGRGSLVYPRNSITVSGSGSTEVYFQSGYSVAIDAPVSTNDRWYCQSGSGAVCTMNLLEATGPTYAECTASNTRFNILNPNNFATITFPHTRNYYCLWDLPTSTVFVDHYADYEGQMRANNGAVITYNKLTVYRAWFTGNSTSVVNSFSRINQDWMYVNGYHQFNFAGSGSWEGHVQIDSLSSVNIAAGTKFSIGSTASYTMTWQYGGATGGNPADGNINIDGQMFLQPPNVWNPRTSMNIVNLNVVVSATGSIVAANSTLRFYFDGSRGGLTYPRGSITTQGSGSFEVSVRGSGTETLDCPLQNNASETWYVNGNSRLNLNMQSQYGPPLDYSSGTFHVYNPNSYPVIYFPTLHGYNGAFEFDGAIIIDTYNSDYNSYLRATTPGASVTIRNAVSTSTWLFEGNGSTTMTGVVSKNTADWGYFGGGHTYNLAGTANWNGYIQFYSSTPSTFNVLAGALIDFNCPSTFYVQGSGTVGVFNNYGTIRKSSTAPMYFQSTKFYNYANAEFHVSRSLVDFNSASPVTLDPNSAFVFHIGGTVAQTNFAQVNFGYTVATNGKVRVAFEGYTPSAGQTFRLFTYSAYTGSFTLDTVTGYGGSASLNQTATFTTLILA